MAMSELSESLGRWLEAPRKDELAKIDNLETLLHDLLDTARTSWPEITLADAVFLEYLAPRLPDELSSRALLRLRMADLWLACACMRGEPRALASLQKKHLVHLPAALRRLRLDPSDVDEVCQRVKEKLLVAGGTEPPRLAKYSGRGDLDSWLRITAIREALSMKRGVKELPAGDDLLLDIPAQGGDPELIYIRDRYKEEFRAAFGEAVEGLTSRQRNLLRHHFMDGLSIDDIGQMYNVHRATAARWVASAKQLLLEHVKSALSARLKLGNQEIDSLFRVLQSQLDVSVARYFQAAED
jgi:RNA polymerase sigma-70 factor, ECF subfamily